MAKGDLEKTQVFSLFVQSDGEGVPEGVKLFVHRSIELPDLSEPIVSDAKERVGD